MNKNIKLADNCSMNIIDGQAFIRMEIFARGSESDVARLFEALRLIVVDSVCKEARISDVVNK